MRSFLLILAFAVTLLSACSRNEPIFPIVPRLTFVSMTPDSAKEFTGDWRITLAYEDGDGDLGNENTDIRNFFVVDDRQYVNGSGNLVHLPDSVRTFDFATPVLRSASRNPSIKGTITVKVPVTGRTIYFGGPNVRREEISFIIYLYDEAGHKSNEVKTPARVIYN